jgi:hypothetical protein
MLKDKGLDMSFSGLKTAVRVLADKEFQASSFKLQEAIPDLCASIQAAITDVLVEKTIRAAKLHHPQAIILVGGVSANGELQKKMALRVKAERSNFFERKNNSRQSPVRKRLGIGRRKTPSVASTRDHPRRPGRPRCRQDDFHPSLG